MNTLENSGGTRLGSVNNTALLRHLAHIARAAGLATLIAEVLSENASMLKVFEKSGLPMTTVHDAEVVHVTLEL